MTKYLEQRIWSIIFYLSFLIVLSIFLLIVGISVSLIVLLVVTLISIYIVFLILEYYNKKKHHDEIIKIVDDLEEKYLLSEIIKKPKSLENEAYYYALKKASIAMNNKISEINSKYKDYEDYIESFVHEIKTPLSALSLYADNTNNNEIKKELFKIDNLLEQVLFYARSENTEKDYFVKEINLEDLIHDILLNYKDYILARKNTLKIHDLGKIVYTDEKWLKFIIRQIIGNALKYMNKEENILEIYSTEEKNSITLCIKDNGIGIEKSDLPRIFEKGFTEKKKKKEYSTGLGLYLCKKLCERLNLNIEADSVYNEYTTFKIILPKTKIYNRK